MKIRVQRGGQLLTPKVTTGATPPATGSGGFSLFGPAGGGFVTGLDMADDGTMYARADVGGAYRKAPGLTSSWTQILTVQRFAGLHADDYYCDAIACSPTQPLNVYAALGVGFRVGRVLRSTDGGATWTQPGASSAAASAGSSSTATSTTACGAACPWRCSTTTPRLLLRQPP